MNPTSTKYQQLLLNLGYLKLKQMTLHLNEVLDYSIYYQLSIIDTLIKLTSYEIDVREQNMTQAMVKVSAFTYRKEDAKLFIQLNENAEREEMYDPYDQCKF